MTLLLSGDMVRAQTYPPSALGAQADIAALEVWKAANRVRAMPLADMKLPPT